MLASMLNVVASSCEEGVSESRFFACLRYCSL